MTHFNPGQTTCAVCGKLLFGGRFAIDAWDNIFCADHRQEYSPCSTCSRLICPRLTGGGVTYADGRQVCNQCRRTAIDTKEQAKPYVEHIAAWLYKIGLRFKGLILKIDLKDAREIAQAQVPLLGMGDRSSPTGMGKGHILGYISRGKQIYNLGLKERRLVKGVTILSGLPRELFEGVVAHELGHAWLFLGKVDNLPPWQEEGFCNLLSYILHREHPTPEANFCLRVLEEDPNPVYGDGFRRVRAIFKKHGFGESLSYTYEHRRFPPE